MDKILYLTLLYDFYGELLTAKQKEIFSLYYLNDWSMQEIGEQFDISRQAVNDLLKRTQKILGDYENKLLLVDEYIMNKDKISAIIGHIDILMAANRLSGQDGAEIKQALSELI